MGKRESIIKARCYSMRAIRRLGDSTHFMRQLTRRRQIPESYSVDGLHVSIPNDGYFGSEIGPDGYEPLTTSIIRQLIDPGMTILDIGAHIGHYTVIAADATGRGGKVFAFEPDPISFEFLRNNITENHLDGVATPIQKAVTDRPGRVRLYSGRRDRVANSILRTNKTSGRYIQCDATTVDAVAAQLRMDAVDLIKIDVEGSEYDVLAGMDEVCSRSPTLKLVVEFYPSILSEVGVSPKEFLDRLSLLGFRRISAILAEPRVINPKDDLDSLLQSAGNAFVNLLCEKVPVDS